MPIGSVGPLLVVRERRGGLVSGAALLLVGGAVGFYAWAGEGAPDRDGRAVGIAFGLVLAAAGWWRIRAGGTLVVDVTRRQVREVRRGALGTTQLVTPFSSIVSVGANRIQDPRTGRVWWLETVLRLADGSKIEVDRGVAIREIAAAIGVPVVDHEEKQVEPPPPSS